ncbi:BTAD domain-containing putative transcriptional regulator [Streptomyces sp. V4I2]|uniref:BTAD domain-containing putative transcriptional regulator n=1 Tax=Streptomyces sp. V4I2 TaxID=3042280 RepID=UPI0027D7EE1E|nr:BTAD domain-containing putative transcriptional regulator [Streptomyces sp. V4I2]
MDGADDAGDGDRPVGDGLSISVLGELTARIGSDVLGLGGRQQRAVLALLLVAHGDVVPADRLVDALWDSQTVQNPVGALHAYVSHLRRQLEPGRIARSRGTVIVSEGSGYALRVDRDAVDAWRFDRLVHHAGAMDEPAGVVRVLSEALALWRGPAFVEYAAKPWAEAEANRLTALRAVARERLLEARLDCGESAVLVPEIEALVSEEPLREERWRLLVLALYRAHRQGEALAALRRARAVLADELGVDPGPALRQLETDVLAQSPALQAPSPADAAPAPRIARSAELTGTDNAPAPVSQRAPRADDTLVERVREVAELRDCLEEAMGGRACLVLVEGPAGIGKTRLLAETRRLAAERGALMMSARGSQLEKAYGFGVVRQLFEPVVADPARRERVLSGAAVSASSVFDVAEAQTQADGSLAALHGLYWLTVNVSAEHPMVLAVDDLQWCDSGSLRFLAYLVGRVQGLPVLIVATLRTGEPHDDEELLAELAHDAVTVRISPPPLTAEGTAELVRHRLGDLAQDVFVAACHRTTSGNPLLLRQLLRALQSEGVPPEASHADTVTAIGSRAVSSMVLMRLARMPRASTAIARAVAVLGSGAVLTTVTALADLPESEAVAAIAALARAEVLRDEYPLSFVHPLVADAVYRDLPPGERQLQHERAARVLHESGAPAEQVAAHLLQVPHRADPWVVRVLRTAAATVAARGAADAAVTYLARALAEPAGPGERPEVLLELGRMEALTIGPSAIEHLREAYGTLPDPAQRAEVAQMLARALVFAGERGEATGFARGAAAALPPDLAEPRQALLALERLSSYMHGLEAAVPREDEPKVVGEGPGARMLAAALAFEALRDGVDRNSTIGLARFALGAGVLLETDIDLMGVTAANVLYLSDGDPSAFWEEALAHAYRRGSIAAALAVNLFRGNQEWGHGDLREAHQSLTTALEQQDRWRNNVGAAYTLSSIVGVLLDLGETDHARSCLEQHAGIRGIGDGARLLAEARAALFIAEGRYEEALAGVEQSRRMAPQSANPAWWPWRSLRGRALGGLGRQAEAIALVEDELAAARRWGAPTLVGRTLRVLGELRGGDGATDLREAVAVLAETPARLEYARALYALAGVAPAAEAVPLLDQSYGIARRCGAAGLCRSIADDLARVGVTAPAEPAGAVTLTSTERRLAAMFADGADERDIAQALFLTPQSVQVTLRSVRGRLAATSRDDLRTALSAVRP